MNRLKTDNPALDFLARRPNLVGLACAIPATLAVIDIGHRPLLGLGAAALTYCGGFLLGADWKPAAKLKLDRSERVEYETITANLRELKGQLEPYRRGRLPVEIIEQLDEVLDRIDALMPHWAQLKTFTEQKFMLNQIVTDYLPHVLNTYMNLPASYYKDSTKHRYAAEVVLQLKLLVRGLDQIQSAIAAGAEREILAQSQFLSQKFTDSGNALLKL